MCRPFNDHEPFGDEFHGLVMFMFAVISLQFLFHTYQPKTVPQNSNKTSKKPLESSSSVRNLGRTSDSKDDYLRLHECRQQQRMKYARHNTLKNQRSGKGPLGSFIRQQFAIGGFNASPFTTPKLLRRKASLRFVRKYSRSNSRSNSCQQLFADNENSVEESSE